MRLGADPEIFLVSGAKHVSAIGYINADKWNPMQIPDMPAGFTLQEDNVSLEYGIPPASTAEEFVAHIQDVMNKSLEYLPGLAFSKLSCVVFDKDQLEHPRASIFGCEADYNAWGDASLDENGDPKNANPRVSIPVPGMRSAGGHIHVETSEDPIQVVQAMDLFLGVPSVLMDKAGAERRKLYGKAGAHRVKSYGVEYRTLSNFWIHSSDTTVWAWNQTQRALQNLGAAQHFREEILAAINHGDEKAALFLKEHCQLETV